MVHQIPVWEKVGTLYDPKKERIIIQNYQVDSLIKMLK